MLYSNGDGCCLFHYSGLEVCSSKVPVKLDEKITSSPIVIRGKVKSRFETISNLEVNVKVNFVYKRNKVRRQRLKFLRLKFKKSDCQAQEENFLMLGK